MADLPIPRLISLFCRSRSFRVLTRSSIWASLLEGPAGGILAPLAAKHGFHELRMLVGTSDHLLPDFIAQERRVLEHLMRAIKELQKHRVIGSDDAIKLLEELRQNEKNLVAIERRASMESPDITKLFAKTLKQQAENAFPHILTPRLRYLTPLVSQTVDPEVHAVLARVFVEGGLGPGAWDRIADAIRIKIVRNGGAFGTKQVKDIEKTVIQYLGELLAASHPAYRRIIKESSSIIRDLGLEPVEVIGSSWLRNGGKQFHDGLLLAVSRPSTSVRIGQAGIVVGLESRPASTLLEAGIAAELEEAAHLRNKAKSAAKQQVGNPVRERAAIAEGEVLLTGDGAAYELIPVPPSLRQIVLSRPHLLPEKEVRWLMIAARARKVEDSLEGQANLLQIVTPFSSEQLGKHAGMMTRGILNVLGI